MTTTQKGRVSDHLPARSSVGIRFAGWRLFDRFRVPREPAPIKHLFFVHSHITFQVAIAIMRKKRIARKDTIFLAGRGFDPKDVDFPVVALPFSDDYFLVYKNFFKGWGYLMEFDAFLSSLCNGEFIFYCPHTYSLFSPIVASHRMHRGYSLIEEGLSSYNSIDEMNVMTPPVRLTRKQKILSRFFYLGRFGDRVFFKRDCLETYATSAQAFPDFPSTITVDINDGKMGRYSDFAREVESLLILDSTVETKAVSADNFIRGFRHIIAHFSGEQFSGKSIHVKLHPYQYVDRWFADQLIEHLKQQLPHCKIIEIPSDVSIENLTVACRADLYVGITSLALYAAREGRKVYSFARRIGELEPGYLLKLSQQPKVFSDAVEFL